MELRTCLKILSRYWWLILLPPLVVAAYGLATYQPPAQVYQGSVRYTAGQPATLAESPGYDPNYYRWLTSEYIVTGLKDWVLTRQFAAAVSEELATRGIEIHPEAVQAALSSDVARSILAVFATSNDPATVVALLDAAGVVLANQNGAAFPQLGGQAAVVVPLEAPGVGPVPPSLRARLDLPLKVGLALAVGVGLALAAHYFDPTVRERGELEALGLSVIGEIPASSRSRR